MLVDDGGVNGDELRPVRERAFDLDLRDQVGHAGHHVVAPELLGDAPGGVAPLAGDIELNAGRTVTELAVTNRGDRPIQVGSHFPFAETNRVLDFDRARARGKRLDIPAGTAVRFEPGDTRTVRLVETRQS